MIDLPFGFSPFEKTVFCRVQLLNRHKPLLQAIGNSQLGIRAKLPKKSILTVFFSKLLLSGGLGRGQIGLVLAFAYSKN
jgi:hypothetical protein